MKFIVVSAALACLIGAVTWSNLSKSVTIDDRDKLWQEVEQAQNQGLPQTAMELLKRIYESAKQAEAYPEATRAICYLWNMEGQVQEGDPSSYVVNKLRVELEYQPVAMHPILKVILADWMYTYYNNYRWQFVNRTRTELQPGEDIRSWDGPQLLAECDRLFTSVLADAEELKKIRIEDYSAILVQGNMPETYRPTVFDFIAYQALSFYKLDEQFTRATNAFDLPASSPIFAEANEFLAWKPESEDQDSRLLKAIAIYQQLLTFHQADEDRSAWLAADLDRLKFGDNEAFGSEKTARYQAALERFIEANLGHETCSLAIYELATIVHGTGDWVKAHEIASRGLALHPTSKGASACFNLIQTIEAVEVTITCERVWNEPASQIEFSYRNLEKVFFRLCKAPDYAEQITGPRANTEYLDHDQLVALISSRPTASWSETLEKTADYKMRSAASDIPVDIVPGRYYLLASLNENFADALNVVAHVQIWVSNLALVMRTGESSNSIDGIVTDAKSGLPIANAKATAWHYNNRANRWEVAGTVNTGEDGLFTIPRKLDSMHLVLVSHGQHQLAIQGGIYMYRGYQEPQSSTRTHLFTDRAIYRPGQTIYFKGISISADPAKNNYSAMPNRSFKLELRDPNQQVIQTLDVRTNEFGSFHGNFTAPHGSVTGQFYMSVNGGPNGYQTIRVEEYKRPKFYVKLETPEQATRLDQPVEITGKATAYTGAAIDGAEVRWKVTRNVRLPQWWYWRCFWFPPLPGDSQEIAYGTTTSEIDGSFKINFVAQPDRTVPRESEPIFTYTISADVVDRTGETRSDITSVRAGYTTMTAKIHIDEFQTIEKPVEIQLSTSTLNDSPLPSAGKLKLLLLKQPEKPQRSKLQANRYWGWDTSNLEMTSAQIDLSDYKTWPEERLVSETEVEIDASGKLTKTFELATGAYRIIYESADEFGEKVSAEFPFLVIDPSAKQFAVKIPSLFDAPSWKIEPGNDFTAVWGTGYESGRAFVQLTHRGKSLQAYWTDAESTQTTIKQAVTEEMRGGFQVHVTYVRENRAYTYTRKVEVPWSNKELNVRWERFVSKLTPGAKETFAIVISGTDSQRVAAELAATLYDASLDAFVNHAWQSSFSVFYQDYSRLSFGFQNQLLTLNPHDQQRQANYRDASIIHRYFDQRVLPYSYFGQGQSGWGGAGGAKHSPFMNLGAAPAAMGRDGIDSLEMAVPRRSMAAAGRFDESAGILADGDMAKNDEANAAAAYAEAEAAVADVDLGSVATRVNLQETAFFFPSLTTLEDGSVRLEFTMPEALTKWKFLGFAHDVNLRAGLLVDELITSKDLMVQPNPPRFLREGDKLAFSVKVTNKSATRQTGKARLAFTDARTDESLDSLFNNRQLEQSFDLPAEQSTSLHWTIEIPDYTGVIVYKAVAATERVSDGEEGMLPVLSRRILVNESLPLPIRGAQTKSFEFERLRNSGESDTLQSQLVTVQMTSNPAWYAVMALPYLMEYPYECSEQVFNRMYANALAQHIANSDPRIRRVFDQWRGTAALDSPLKKNRDLLNVVIEETPWLLSAVKETDARNNVGVLFDTNRLQDEIDRSLQKLREMQHEDGAWPWFPGGRGNDYITLYVITGFGRLKHMGVISDDSLAINALSRIDGWLNERYQNLLKSKRNLEEFNLDATICLYLYGRSFFKEHPIDPAASTAFKYYMGQAKKYWLSVGQRQSQGQLAIGLKRFGDLDTPKKIMASLKERAVVDEELGMLWRDGQRSWWWYQAPIETQAIMIEAFDEVAADNEAVELCKVWLLKQKQTQQWETTKATADAVYSLLLRGDQLLKSTALVSVSVAGEEIRPEQIEAGTGFYEKRFVRSEIRPELGQIELKKTDAGVAWGSIHWQYLEDISKITPYEGTPLTLKKRLYRKVDTDKGKQLVEIDGPVNVGDELVTRVELRVDRDMEFVHLKDYRGSGTEPVDVLSGYRYQDGLAYYQSTRDTASHFFIDYLPRGTYVFEYSVRVQHRGDYQTGIASIQCMYAPEFNSHSNSVPIKVE
ncbi:MAG TPA: alpha-2-macroglobulin family protein [Pirellulaceae bacterium]|nr:alpha-2-macroglobulin family protein [Pirellulaceae bacterium]HMO91218.1 alpha-2-macroglobulin family protein [Pirellulaceae bacterium]HMP70801.1 alpha-2-macroglobulin family protein [Pirellulaceae bacterium]